ncbi:hypothetical protein J5U22_00571 [Saccharolobus shibatae]|uniref:Uncharacterized protein n=1 Tax=Saccharolobus shibatae TaxID=2286 RepID=A0A8F5BZ47_9CREN|nr:hypothetical protein J5U22_00571 [Saccharolobus shibatae]
MNLTFRKIEEFSKAFFIEKVSILEAFLFVLNYIHILLLKD